MIWKKYTIKTNNNDLDLVSSVLMDFDINDIQIENNIQLTDEELNAIYADFKKELPEDDGTCMINFYLDEDMCIPGESVGTGDSPETKQGRKIDIAELENALKEASDLFGISPVSIEMELSDTADWEDKWKEYFKTFEVDGIVIKPSWEEAEADTSGKIVIEIDPGMAFGTGLHETTRLCLKGMKKYLKADSKVLDLGCGSGILGIAALKSDAKAVTAVDIDEQAVKVAYENFENNISEDDSIYESHLNDDVVLELNVGDVITDDRLTERLSSKKYDLVFANILAEVICKLLPKVHLFMEDGAHLITSGILKEKEEMVREAVKANEALEYVETTEDGDWVSIVIRKAG